MFTKYEHDSEKQNQVTILSFVKYPWMILKFKYQVLFTHISTFPSL